MYFFSKEICNVYIGPRIGFYSFGNGSIVTNISCIHYNRQHDIKSKHLRFRNYSVWRSASGYLDNVRNIIRVRFESSYLLGFNRKTKTKTPVTLVEKHTQYT